MERIIYQSSYFNEDPEESAVEYGDSQFFDDELCNLNISVDTDILAIANMGLWSGRVMGYKKMSTTLSNILSAFSSCDYIQFKAEGKEIVGVGIHHDGTNTAVFRRWKKNTSEKAKEDTIEAIYMGRANADELVKKNTKSLYKDVQKIYGW